MYGSINEQICRITPLRTLSNISCSLCRATISLYPPFLFLPHRLISNKEKEHPVRQIYSNIDNCQKKIRRILRVQQQIPLISSCLLLGVSLSRNLPSSNIPYPINFLIKCYSYRYPNLSWRIKWYSSPPKEVTIVSPKCILFFL